MRYDGIILDCNGSIPDVVLEIDGQFLLIILTADLNRRTRLRAVGIGRRNCYNNVKGLLSAMTPVVMQNSIAANENKYFFIVL